MADIQSRPYKPVMACERCAFGRGHHATFCPSPRAHELLELGRAWMKSYAIIEDPDMPKDQAALMSSDGQVVIITGLEVPE